MGTIRTLAVLMALSSFASLAAAQGVDTGSLRGRVADASGAALAGVTVTAASAAVMGGHLTAVTSEEGLYRFPSPPPGACEVRMELTGFQAIALSGVRINVGLALTIGRVLEVSSIQETLTVAAESPIVDTKNTSAEVSWTPRAASEHPLVARPVVDGFNVFNAKQRPRHRGDHRQQPERAASHRHTAGVPGGREDRVLT